MTVTIRRIENSEHEYFAYAKSICGKATYFVYFTDDIWGAVVLHNFVEMLLQFLFINATGTCSALSTAPMDRSAPTFKIFSES